MTAVQHDALRLGDFEIVPICDATTQWPLADEIPDEPPGGWGPIRERYGWAFAGEQIWEFHLHAFVVRTPETTIVVDTGIGAVPPEAWGLTPSRFAAGLERAGVNPAEVRHVALTHLHPDHLGGIVDAEGAPRFPNARHHVHILDRDAFAAPTHPQHDHYERAVGPVERAGLLDATDTDVELAPGVIARHDPGHTAGHRTVELASGSARAVLAGDAICHPAQVEHPGWETATDDEPELAAATRTTLVETAVRLGWVVAPSHTAHPFGRVVRTDAGFRWRDV